MSVAFVWPERARGALVGAIPSDVPRYEPMIVSWLRHFRRRGAPQRLLDRIAGSATAYRLLDDSWGLAGPRTLGFDGRPLFIENPLEPIEAGLSIGARRIALAQLAEEYDDQGAPLPSARRLALHLGVSRNQIYYDLMRGGDNRFASRSEADGALTGT